MPKKAYRNGGVSPPPPSGKIPPMIGLGSDTVEDEDDNNGDADYDGDDDCDDNEYIYDNDDNKLTSVKF